MLASIGLAFKTGLPHNPPVSCAADPSWVGGFLMGAAARDPSWVGGFLMGATARDPSWVGCFFGGSEQVVHPSRPCKGKAPQDEVTYLTTSS